MEVSNSIHRSYHQQLAKPFQYYSIRIEIVLEEHCSIETQDETLNILRKKKTSIQSHHFYQTEHFQSPFHG